MGNKKRILAWLLSLVMVFGLFGGQVTVAKAADAAASIYSMSINPKTFTSDGGKLTATITFDDFSSETRTVYYQLQKKDSDGAYQVVDGKDNVEAQVVSNALEIDIPANTETTEAGYKLVVNTNSGKFETAWGTLESGAKKATFTVAAAAETPDQPDQPTKVLPDATHFRARAVDKSGKPMSGIKFDIKGNWDSSSVTSDENGVVEWAPGEYDYGTKTVALSANDDWACDNTYKLTLNWSGEIEKINDTAVADVTDELQFVLKVYINKTALKTAIDKASVIKNAEDYSAGYEELQTALTEANKVYENEDATQAEVDEQTTKLTAALDAVVVKTVDKTKLKSLIDEASEKNNDRYSFTTATWNEVDKAWTAAKTINSNDKAGQTAIDEAAANLETALKALKYNPRFDSVERISDENVSSKGGEVQIKLVGKSMENMTYKTRVKDGSTEISKDDYKVSFGEGETERVATVTLPENTTSEEKTYTVGFMQENTYNVPWREVTFKVAAGAEKPDAVKSDENTFRAKVVDEKGNPVSGVKFLCEDTLDGNNSYDLESDEKGILEYEITGEDAMYTYQVALADNSGYTSDDKCTFEVGGTFTKPVLKKVNDKDLADADEVVFVVKKNGASEEDKVLSDATTFRAKIVDEKGNPVEGVSLAVKDSMGLGGGQSTPSNAKGVTEYKLVAYADWELTFTAEVVSGQGYSCSDSHQFITTGPDSDPKITTVDGVSIDSVKDEIVYTVKKTSGEDKVSCDATHFRAKVVDAEGNPVANAVFEVKAPGRTHEITSNEKGVIEYAFNEADDIDATITVTLKDNDTWATLDEHKIVTDAMANIYSVDGNEGYAGEFSYILRKKVDKTALGEALEKVKELVESDYTEDSWSAFKLVLDTAQKTYENDHVNKEDVDAQIEKLDAGVKALVVKPAKKDELNAEKDKASKLDKSDYTEESWKAVEDALAEIEALEKEDNVLQSKVDAAQEKLAAALEGLKKADKPEPKPEVKKVASVALKTTSYTYNGKVKTPVVVAKNNKKEVISKDYYTVKYASGRKNVGKYSVTVTFKNGYTGKYTKTFQILPKGTKIKSVKAGKKSFTAKWYKKATQTTGYQLQYSTGKTFKKSVKTSTISKNKTVSKTVKKLSAKKTYYVRVRTYKTVKVSGKSVKLYSGWSTVKKVKTK